MTIIKDYTFKILILSENVNFRNILASKLRLDNFEVEFISGGFHLLNYLETNQDMNMIICNEDMPDMSAMEIISMVRQDKTKSEMPIVFISKNDNEEEICDMIFNGANDYIVQTDNFRPIQERAHKYMQIIKQNAAWITALHIDFLPISLVEFAKF